MSLIQCEAGLDQLSLVLERSKRVTSPVRLTRKSNFYFAIRKGGLSGVKDFTLVLTIQRPDGFIVRWGRKVSSLSGTYAGTSVDLQPQMEGFLLRADIFPYQHIWGTQMSLHLNVYELGVNDSDINLITGYPDQILSWPDHVGRPWGAEPGSILTFVGTDPAAGAEASETVPAGVMWEILTLNLVFVTDGTVSNRVTTFVFDDGANIFLRLPPSGVTPASTSQVNNLIQGAGSMTGSPNTIGMGRVILKSGYRFRTITTNLQAGDNYATPNFLVKEWVTQ